MTGPIQFMQAPQPFAVINLGRSGTALFVELLNQIEGISLAGEIFIDVRGEGQIEFIDRLAAGQSLRALTTEPTRKWKWRFGEAHSFRGAGRHGFVTKVSDLDAPQAIREKFRQHKFKLIHLTRRNLVRVAISIFTGVALQNQIGFWHIRDAKDAVRQIAIPPQEFRRMLNRVALEDLATRQFLALSGCDCLEIYYEDLVKDRNHWMKAVLHFLELPEDGQDLHTLRTTLVRNAPGHTWDTLLNVQELRAACAGTRYRAMFD